MNSLNLTIKPYSDPERSDILRVFYILPYHHLRKYQAHNVCGKGFEMPYSFCIINFGMLLKFSY